MVKVLSWLPIVAFAVGGACSPPDAATDPTWADVYPILQGQCLHCHGSTAAKDGGNYRFDLLDASSVCKQEEADDLVAGLSPPSSFYAARRLILADITPYAAGFRPKMPPEPGRALEGWQAETLERFVAKLDALPFTEAMTAGLGPLPADARSPTISASYARNGNTLVVDYVVEDENADAVVGQLRVGQGLRSPIEGSGRGQARFDLGGTTGPWPIDARLCDGWDVRTRGAPDGLPTVPP